MSKLRFIKIIILISIFTSMAQALEVNSKNLKTLIEQKNSRISASQFQIQAAQEREGLLLRSFLPSVRLSASQESFETGVNSYRTQPAYGAEGVLNLYNGGKDSFESEIRKNQTSLKTVHAQQVLNLELQKTRNLYWEILYLQNRKALLKEIIQINESNTSAALKRIRSGIATNTDKLEFDMEAVNLEREYERTEIELQNSIALLGVLINLDSKEKIELTEDLVHEHEMDPMLAHDPKSFEFIYKDLELNSKIYNLQADKSVREIWPKLDAFANYNQFNQRDRDFFSSVDRDEYAIGLRITIDIPAGFESNREAAFSRYQAKSSEALNHIEKNEAATHINNEMKRLNFLHEQVHNAEENIGKSENYYRATQSEYNRGVKNSPDVLAASQRLFEMKHKRLEIVRDFQVAKGHILSQTGK